MEDFIPGIVNRNSIAADYCLDNDFDAGNALSAASVIESQQIDLGFNFTSDKANGRRRTASLKNSECSGSTRCVDGTNKEELVKAYYYDDEIINLKGGDDFFYSFMKWPQPNSSACNPQWTQGNKDFSMGNGDDYASLNPTGHPLNQKQVIKGKMGKGDDIFKLNQGIYGYYPNIKAKGQGGNGDDYLYSNVYNSTLQGGSGDDLIEASATNEKMLLTGGQGSDIFNLDLETTSWHYEEEENMPGKITVTDFSIEEGDIIAIINLHNSKPSKDWIDQWKVKQVGNDIEIKGSLRHKYALIKNVSRKEFLKNDSMIHRLSKKVEDKYSDGILAGTCKIDNWIWSEDQYYYPAKAATDTKITHVK